MYMTLAHPTSVFLRSPEQPGARHPESAFRHAVLEELLEIVGIGLGHPPVTVLMGLALWEEPQRPE